MTDVTARIQIRSATLDDLAQIAQVHVESWRSTYAGILPDRVLCDLDPVRQEQQWRRTLFARERRRQVVHVAVAGKNNVVGFASAGGARDPAYRTEVYTLYLDDGFRGIGIGRLLFASTASAARKLHGLSTIVWCLSNSPSKYFYEHLGGVRVATRMSRIGGALLEETGYAWTDAKQPAARLYG